MERGRLAGRVEGLAEGEATMRRQTILRGLELRFGPLSQDLIDRISALHDDAELRRGLDRAVLCGSLAMFDAG